MLNRVFQLRDMIFRDVDLPWHALPQLPALQAAASKPFEDRLRRYAQRDSHPLNRIAPVRPSRRIGLRAVDLDRRNGPAPPQQVNEISTKRRTASRDISFSIEELGNFGVHFMFGVQLPNATFEIIQLGVLVIGLDLPCQPMFTEGSGRPGNLDEDLTSFSLLVQNYVANEETQHLFAVRCRGGRRMPNFWQIFAHRQKRFAIGFAQIQRLLGTPALEGLFGCFDLP